MQKQWHVADSVPADFSFKVGVSSPIVAQLLWNRGMRSFEEVQAFLHPEWVGGVHDPSQFRHLVGAMQRVFSALEQNERITVHGDYDADGVTGSTVMITTLREIEKKMTGRTSGSSCVDYYIPHRDKEGYGLHAATVPILHDRGTKLIITVDCGIACVDEIAAAKSVGIDTIVVDHHQFGERLPDGFLIHPGLPEETYPFKKLAAVGVAFKFACALFDEARKRGIDVPVGSEKWLLDLVAIATVTDMVPLVGENRVLERYGLTVLNKTRRPGLLALLLNAGLELGALDTESVGFGIGPRLNAAGRMDHASLALRLLLSETNEEAKTLAAEIEQCNRARQQGTRAMMEQAELELSKRDVDAPMIVLWNKGWSPALVGLVAGKCLDRFGCPTVVIGHHDGKWIGSGRSLACYDVTDAVRTAGDGLLLRAGGHVQACGFSVIDEASLSVFAERLTAHATNALTGQNLAPTLEIDAEISLDRVDRALVDTQKTLEPFGEGNRRPTYLSRKCFVAKCDLIGATQNHLRLSLVKPSGGNVQAIAFNWADRAAVCPTGSCVDLVYTVDLNSWNGRESVQCRMVDIRKAE